jgi:lysophospholipid acyltransferase (LPLAT)-like uncharacterized protein
MAAREASAKVIPFSWEADSYWQLKTWDQLRIPKPFTKVKVMFGDPLTAAKENRKNLEDEVAIFQAALQKISNTHIKN